MKISTSVVPPEGWRFLDHQILFQEQTFNDLVKKVIDFRSANSFDIGNPEQEIMDSICRNFPSTCIDMPSVHNTPIERIKSFVQTLFNYFVDGAQLVQQEEADRRAEICVQCHANLDGGQARTQGCCGAKNIEDKTIEVTRKQILKEKKTSVDDRLKSCFVCGCENKLAVWFPVKYLLKKEDANAFPVFCWRKDILNQ